MPQNSIDRFLGYKKALLDNNMPYDSSLVYICQCGDQSFEEGKMNARQLLKDHKDVDGIFINTDMVAISIVGFSNWFMSSVISPSLTTIDQPGYLMGKTAFERLYKEMQQVKNKKPIVYKDVVLETGLIKRQSTKDVLPKTLH